MTLRTYIRLPLSSLSLSPCSVRFPFSPTLLLFAPSFLIHLASSPFTYNILLPSTCTRFFLLSMMHLPLQLLLLATISAYQFPPTFLFFRREKLSLSFSVDNRLLPPPQSFCLDSRLTQKVASSARRRRKYTRSLFFITRLLLLLRSHCFRSGSGGQFYSQRRRRRRRRIGGERHKTTGQQQGYRKKKLSLPFPLSLPRCKKLSLLGPLRLTLTLTSSRLLMRLCTGGRRKAGRTWACLLLLAPLSPPPKRESCGKRRGEEAH